MSFRKAFFALFLLIGLFIFSPSGQVHAVSDVVPNGIYIEGTDVSFLTLEEAEQTVHALVRQYLESNVELYFDSNTQLKTTAKEIGVTWSNVGVAEAMFMYGQRGNVVARYKMLKRIKEETVDYKLEFSLDRAVFEEYLNKNKESLYVAKEEASLSKVGDAFVIVGAVTGKEVNVDKSYEAFSAYFSGGFNKDVNRVALTIREVEPLYKADLLAEVNDLIGSFTTSYKTSGPARSHNIENAAMKVGGRTVYPGEEFSTVSLIAPFTKENGYEEAHSYYAGRVIDSVGGGICQISSTIYNAVLLAELEVVKRANHALTVNYVPLSQDATISEDAGIDFVWMNSSDYPVYVECITNDKKELTVNIYGKETRDANRTIAYEPEVISKTEAEGECVYGNSDKKAGYLDIQSAHAGYKTKLWKIEYVDGKEVSRKVVNESTYRSAKRTATIGTKTKNTKELAALNRAIESQSINTATQVVNEIRSGKYLK